MEQVKKERQSNIELLRILLIIGVIILHYNNKTIGGGFEYVKYESIIFYILYILESVFICAVNLFMLISGYFMCTSYKRNLWKPIELVVQVILFSLGIYFFKIILKTDDFSIKSLFGRFVPANYFVILYIVVYFFSPFVNKLLYSLDNKQLKLFVITSVLLFSVYPTLVDIFRELTGKEWNGLSSIGMYGSQWGYSVVNFLLMYILGAYIKIQGYSNLHQRNIVF